ncbi:MAG: hypothetical protein L3K14_05745 [Thermoplasmata archaeon]|nr:hypothetical protein [Thermoplasmata archaeon]
MSGNSEAGPGGRPSRQLQWPFVGVVVLLVVLILLTPNLLATSAGGLQTRAQLVVDRATAGGPTSFYVESIGTTTRYESIAIGLTSPPFWPYSGSIGSLTRWNWTNGTETLALIVRSATNPVVVNISVKYTDPSGFTADYIGLFGFYLNATTHDLETMDLLPGGAGPMTATPLPDLPIFLLLALRTTPGGP